MFKVKKPIVGKPKKLFDPAQDEDHLQRQIVAKMRAHGAFVILTDAVGPALKFISDQKRRMGFISWSKARGWEKGVPDLVCVWKGNILFLELKTPTGKGKLSPEQIVWKNRIISAGYEYACWNTLKECEDWIVSKLNNSSDNGDNV